ncbi:zinc finger BED domain-containing protein 1-like [Aphis craccivora]|uniref:Zinc finger BED domain-containing protein 1-like n=1 Tax=Aphis craccivora TaxID=307492 RepID=A0A6G0YQG8_APHCR|nr:zinc finger BED domain-containing protein 1-like [Aphis craccivora]
MMVQFNCRECKSIIAYSVQHIKNIKFIDMCTKIICCDGEGGRSKKLTNGLMTFFIKDLKQLKPISIAEGEGFR